MTSIPGANNTNKTEENRNSAARSQAERQKQLDGLRNFEDGCRLTLNSTVKK